MTFFRNTVRILGRNWGNSVIVYYLNIGEHGKPFYYSSARLVEDHYLLSENWDRNTIENSVAKTRPNFIIENWSNKDTYGVEHTYKEAERRVRERANRRARYVKNLVEGVIFRQIKVDKNPITR